MDQVLKLDLLDHILLSHQYLKQHPRINIAPCIILIQDCSQF